MKPKRIAPVKFPISFSLKGWSWGRKLIAFILASTGLTISVAAKIEIEVTETPVEYRNGWAGEEEVAAESGVRASMAPFNITGIVRDNTKANVRLWNAATKILGKFPPNYPQQVGDCVSFGAKNAIQYTLLAQLAANDVPPDLIDVFGDIVAPRGPPIEYREVHPSYIYGISRVQIGKGRLGRGDGSMGVWAAKGVNEYGAIGLEEGPKYSGSLAREWGYSGPPLDMIKLGKTRLVRTVAPVNTPEDVRDAICNGYACTIASSFGSNSFDTKDGRKVARGDGSWAHQMCIIAYDGSASEPYWYVLNSWGETAHPAPMQGEPPGGFWITTRQLKSILSANDSFAFSAFDGFPSRELNFNVFGIVGNPVAKSDPPTIKVPYLGSASMPATCLGGTLLIVAALLLLKINRKTVVAASIALACLFGSQVSADDGLTDAFSGNAVHLDVKPLELRNVFSGEQLAGVDYKTPNELPIGNLFCSEECDCQKSGVCDCLGCTCKGPRTETAYVYVTPESKASTLAAARLASSQGKIPATLRIVVTSQSPDWVTAYPTWHYRSGTNWRQSQNMTPEQFLGLYAMPTKQAVYQLPYQAQQLSYGFQFLQGNCANGRCGR